MKTLSALGLCASALSAAEALSIPRLSNLLPQVPSPERYLIETAPGVTQLVTLAEKWQLRRVCLLRLTAFFAGAISASIHIIINLMRSI